MVDRLMLKIAHHLELWLPTQPEYRMGYQMVVATLNTGSIESGIIVNSQIFLKRDDYPWQMLMDWPYIIREAEKSSLFVKTVTLIPRSENSLKGVKRIALEREKFHVLKNRKDALITFSSGPAKLAILQECQSLAIKSANAAAEDAPVTLTQKGEIFKRFSAYSNDRRITPGRGLFPGTFATTKEDADANIKTGSDAVARYALPNSKPASNVFTIYPPEDIDVKRGTAQPANNQPGGGAEVIFVNGTPDSTVYGPETIPDK